MVICAIFGCNNTDRKVKSTDIKLHRFPKEDDVQKKWITACNRSDNFNPNNSRVCSIHFTEDDYQRNLKYELLGYHSRHSKTLKLDAVPSLHLGIVVEQTRKKLKRNAVSSALECSSRKKLQASHTKRKNKNVSPESNIAPEVASICTEESSHLMNVEVLENCIKDSSHEDVPFQVQIQQAEVESRANIVMPEDEHTYLNSKLRENESGGTSSDWHIPVVTMERDPLMDPSPEMILPDWSYLNPVSDSEAEEGQVALETKNGEHINVQALGREELFTVLETPLDVSVEIEESLVKTEARTDRSNFPDVQDMENRTRR